MALNIPALTTDVSKRGFMKDAKSENNSRYRDTVTALTRTIDYSWLPDSRTVVIRDSAKNVDIVMTPTEVTAKAGANTVQWKNINTSADITSANVKTIVDSVLAAIATKKTAFDGYVDTKDAVVTGDANFATTVTAVNTALT